MNNESIDSMIKYLEENGDINVLDDGTIYLNLYGGGFGYDFVLITKEEIAPIYRAVLKDSVWGSAIYYSEKVNKKLPDRVLEVIEIWKGYEFPWK